MSGDLKVKLPSFRKNGTGYVTPVLKPEVG